MLVTSTIHFAPRTVALARTQRAVHFGKVVRAGFRRLRRRIAILAARMAQARQYERELAELLRADDRMLSDIGITRSEVMAAAQSRWFAKSRLGEAAAKRRDDAIVSAQTRRELPRVTAPTLAPIKATVLTVETANYR